MILKTNAVRIRNQFDKLTLLKESDDFRIKFYEDSEERHIEPFLFINADEDIRKDFNEKTKVAPPSFVIEVENFSLFGYGLIVDSKGFLIARAHNFPSIGRFDLPNNLKLLISHGNEFRTIPDIKFRVIKDDVAIISQAGQGVYGHWLVDILPRIGLMESVGFKGKFVLYEPIPDFAKQLLELFNIPLSRIVTYQPRTEGLVFTKAFIPSSLRFKGAFSKKMLHSIERFSKTKALAGGRKIFISRSKYKKNQIVTNRKEIEAIAIRHGFEIVYPEKLTISQQFSLFGSARILAGEYGSGMHNSIFCNSSCKVLVFQSKTTPVFLQAGLSDVIGQPIGYVFGKSEGENRVFSIDSENAEYAFSQLY